MGARTFLRLKKWGQELYWTGEIGGLVVFFDREIPQNPAWVPGKFWTVPEMPESPPVSHKEIDSNKMHRKKKGFTMIKHRLR